eukprot:scaffold139172_cov169-Phaeocystis_antarctica.AAC.1
MLRLAEKAVLSHVTGSRYKYSSYKIDFADRSLSAPAQLYAGLLVGIHCYPPLDHSSVQESAPQGLVWGSCSQAVASCAAALAYACALGGCREVGSHSTANAIPR